MMKMKSPRAWFSLAVSLLLTSLPSVSLRAADSPKAGDPAPDFALPGSDGKMHALSTHKGKRAVVIAWFPKAFTGG